MKETILYLSFLIIVMLPACSAETARRAAYDSLQNKSDMDCRSNPGANCTETKSYDEYQRDLNKK
jgi:hypothetical protein